MEGEVSQPFVPAVPVQSVQSSNIVLETAAFGLHARYTGDAAFGPQVARAILSSGPYQLDPDALLESIGGGVYRVSTPTLGGQPMEFFRVSFNRP
jgi:hypothetical protein